MDREEQPTVEILDDSPRARPRRAAWQKWPELVLGLALLLLIGGSASWDWWWNQSRLDSYRDGLRYAEQNRWESALAAYLKASGYKDADARVTAARQHIGERDQRYADAAAESANGQWAAALRDWRAVSASAPGFRDSQDLLFAAERRVYALALSGTVALRPSAWPPGLYWYTAAGWTWLVGSDAASQVRGSSSTGCIVYDVPAPGAPAVETPDSAPPADLSGPRARGLMAARKLGSGGIFAPLVADLARFDSFTCDEQGVLAELNERQTRRIVDPRLERIWTPYSGVRLAYQAYSSAGSTTLSLPAAPLVALVITPDSRRELVGDYTSATGDHPQTSLYLASFQGNRVLLAVRPGIVQGAWFSPDRQYLLIDEFSPLPGGLSEEHRLVVLALAGSKEAVTAVSVEAPRPISWETNWYSISFIASGLYAGKALVRGNPGVDRQIKLVDPARPDQVSVLVELGFNVSRFIPYPLDTGIFISLTDWAGVQVGNVYVDGAGRSTGLLTLTGHWLRLGWAAQKDDRLIYALFDAGRYGGGTIYSVRSLSVMGSNAERTASTVLYDDSSQLGSSGFDNTGRSWAAGAGLFAYIRGGRLYAKTYDGAVDLPLNDDIARLYSLTD